MIKDLVSSVCKNKNLLMTVSVVIYILGIIAALNNRTDFFVLFITLIFIFLIIKNIIPTRIIIIWTIIFYIGIINTSVRLKETDDILSLAPVNSVIYGKIISIPQIKDNNKVKFFFKVNQIEYDNMVKTYKNEKVLVSIDTNEKLNIYDSYKIRGRLSPPFKAGNPSQFDYGNYLKNYGVYAVFYGRNPYSMKDLDIPCYEKIPEKHAINETFLQEVNNYREKILKVHSKYMDSPNLEILGGIVFGDDAVSPPENIKQSFINSGLLHILAASGMNVAFIYSFFFFLLNFCKVPFRINICTCMLAVITYILMTGLGASVVRAGLMLLFVLAGKMIDREAHSISLLSFVAFLMLIYNPLLINDVGFQLSFIVTFGLLVMTPYLLKSKYRFVNWVIGSISIPIIAQIWVIPIQIFYFNNISLYSVFANIMSVPFLSVISFGGFVSSLLSIITPISEFICHITDIILNPLISLIINISDFWGSLPLSSVQTTHPSFFQIILYYLILLNITGFIDKQIREKYNSYLKTSLILFVCILAASLISVPNHNLEITAFDVGNADAFMIKTPDNNYIMIDSGKSGYNGGKSQAEMIILKYFKDNGIKNLNSIIITHFDNDHCGGASDLIKNLKTEHLYVNSTEHKSNQAQDIYKTANEKSVKIFKAQNNQIVYNKNNLIIKNYIADNQPGIGDNESSVITFLSYNDFTMLFTGDAGISALYQIKEFIPRNITVLKVGHHGAAGVINKELADYLNPEYSIVSTGENKFGHPSVYTLSTLRNTKILRTDINNSVKIIVNKKVRKVETYNNIKHKYI